MDANERKWNKNRGMGENNIKAYNFEEKTEKGVWMRETNIAIK